MEEKAQAIRLNLKAVRERIRRAAVVSGRDPASARLVVVTKAQPFSVIRAVIQAGADILGENYTEESLPKMQAAAQDLPDAAVAWHMIGHLQSRKAGIVADHFQMLHALDSLRLAEKLDRLLVERGKVLPVLLEVNVGGEESKYGWPAWNDHHLDALLPEIDAIMRLPGLAIRGLMTMPPFTEDPQLSRPYFSKLRSLGNFFAERFGREHFLEFSMGTSSDFEVAVEEGATLVRVGTAIVGPRPPKSA